VSIAGRHRVVVTGLGAVSPNGIGVPSFTRALREGRSGVRALPFVDERIRSRAGAICVEFDPSSVLPDAELKRLPRMVPMALQAAREACAAARLPDFARDESLVPGARRVGLILGTGGGGIDFTLDQAAKTTSGGRPSLWSITNATHGNLAGELSIHLGLRGPNLCVSDGCASSSDAIGLAMELLRSSNPGAPDAMVVVGADAHVRADVLLSMELLGVISTRPWNDASDDPRDRCASASRPFDRTRDGFVLGEGAWALVLERESSAKRREVEPLAQMLGYGATCDAHHRVRPAPDMAESARAMTLAIEDAALSARDVEVVHYHGTGTKLNDDLETRAVKLALGEDHARRVAGTSVKSMIGHPQGACGGAAVVATIASLRALDGGAPFIAPTINLHEPDDACDLDYTPNVARETDAKVALVNCLAFGAKNSALVVRVV
jgi:3-oxoacyl-[acyl-carrier-protein] synthase II